MLTNKLKCLFGFHKFTIPNENDEDVLLCEHCRRFGLEGNDEWGYVTYEYDKEGNIICMKYDDNSAEWMDECGNVIHRLWEDGWEEWYDDRGNIIKTTK